MNPISHFPKARQFRLNIRLSQQEWDKVHKLASKTTCRSVSEYARKVLAEKPVKVFYRNQSFDEFEDKMTLLLPQLEAFGDNFADLVKKISILDQIPEFKATLALLQSAEKGFSSRVEEIRGYIEKLSNQCDQK